MGARKDRVDRAGVPRLFGNGMEPGRIERGSRWPLVLFAVLGILVLLLAVQHALNRQAVLKAVRTEETRRAADLAAHLIEAEARAVLETGFEGAFRRLQAHSDRLDALRQSTTADPVAMVTLHRGTQRIFPPEDATRSTPFEVIRLAVTEPLLSKARNAPSGQPAFGVLENGIGLAGCRSIEADETLCLVLTREAALGTVARALERPLPGGVRPLTLHDDRGAVQWGAASATGFRQALAGPVSGWGLALSSPQMAPDWADAFPFVLAAAVLLILAMLWHRQVQQSRRVEEKARRAEAAAHLSHDLRTPLANLRLYAALIAAGHPQDGALKAQCAIIEAETERLAALAETLLRKLRGEEPRDAASGPRAVDTAIGEVLGRYGPMLDRAGCQVAFVPVGQCAGLRHAESFERCLVNLIDNLCRHAPGTAARLEAWIENATLRVHFAHAVPSRPSAGGTGLGLSILAALTEDAGGEFANLSDAGQMLFSLAWPLRQEEPA